MPTNSNSYNTRLTDETLEARFRETFRSQGGAELVDDLYASGVIVPVVDFTAAAEGSALRQDLQSAWDFTTGSAAVSNGNNTIVSNAGFWKVDLVFTSEDISYSPASTMAEVEISDGLSTKRVWFATSAANAGGATNTAAFEESFLVFLRPGDDLVARSADARHTLSLWWRQIADSNGGLVNPSGFSFS